MELTEMDSQVTIGKQLEILYEQGAALSLEFGTEQSELEKLEDKEEREREQRGHWRETIGFEDRYQRWYSIALPLMKKLAPDRYAEFQAYYRPDSKREGFEGYSYVIQDYFCHRPIDADYHAMPWAATLRCFLSQLTILKSVADRLEWQALVTEDQSERVLQLEELEAARGLIEVSERAAGALAGTVLDAWLRKLAAKRQVPLRKQRPPVRELADALKAAKVFDVAVWSQATWLAEIRDRVTAKEGENADFAGAKICPKTEGEEPTKLQVRDLIDGTHWLITNVF
jgi:hypothetical protein